PLCRRHLRRRAIRSCNWSGCWRARRPRTRTCASTTILSVSKKSWTWQRRRFVTARPPTPPKRPNRFRRLRRTPRISPIGRTRRLDRPDALPTTNREFEFGRDIVLADSSRGAMIVVQQLTLNPQALIPRVVGRYSPVVVDHAEGIYVWDLDGTRYMDFTS